MSRRWSTSKAAAPASCASRAKACPSELRSSDAAEQRTGVHPTRVEGDGGDLDGGYVEVDGKQLESAEACALDDVVQPSGHWFILRWSGSRCRWASG